MRDPKRHVTRGKGVQLMLVHLPHIYASSLFLLPYARVTTGYQIA
jgi:hypothetical protein